MRKPNRQNAGSDRDRLRGRQDLDRRVETVTRRSIDGMITTIARQAHERFPQHA